MDNVDDVGEGAFPYVMVVRGVAALFVFNFCYIGAERVVGDWLATYIVSVVGGSASEGAEGATTYWAGIMVGRVLSIPISIALFPGEYLAIDLVLILGLAVILLLLGTSSLMALYIVAASIGVALSAMHPMAIALGSTRFPTTGKRTSCYLSGASLGSLTLSTAIGLLLEAHPWVFGWGFLVFSLGCLLSYLMVITMPLRAGQDGRTCGRSEETPDGDTPVGDVEVTEESNSHVQPRSNDAKPD